MYRFFHIRLPQKAFTLIEAMITMAVFIIAIYFISPVIFRLQDNIALQQEMENIQSFIYHIQTKARYQKRNYSLTISQNEQQNKWCFIAIQKEINNAKQIACDCLNLTACGLKQPHFVYQNHHSQIILKNKSLYPKAFINIDGVAGSLESKCIQLSRNNFTEILQFNQAGRIYAIPKNKRSTCKD